MKLSPKDAADLRLEITGPLVRGDFEKMIQKKYNMKSSDTNLMLGKIIDAVKTIINEYEFEPKTITTESVVEKANRFIGE